jgi:hypothetical protein
VCGQKGQWAGLDLQDPRARATTLSRDRALALRQAVHLRCHPLRTVSFLGPFPAPIIAPSPAMEGKGVFRYGHDGHDGGARLPEFVGTS